MTVMLTHIVLRPLGLRINKLTFVKSPNAPTDYRLAIWEKVTKVSWEITSLVDS